MQRPPLPSCARLRGGGVWTACTRLRKGLRLAAPSHRRCPSSQCFPMGVRCSALSPSSSSSSLLLRRTSCSRFSFSSALFYSAYAIATTTSSSSSGGGSSVSSRGGVPSLEVEVLAAEAVPPSTASQTGNAADARIAAVTVITEVDPYAKAKVMNFVRRLVQQQQQQQQVGGGPVLKIHSSSHDGQGPSPGASPTASAATTPGMDVREVQGGSAGEEAQYHARWHLPLPAEYGERYGEGFASTAKEAEVVAAMHAERVIDALGFPLFLLSSKQRKHAEAARAAGRWAPLPPSSTSSDESAAELVPPPDTPSPPPLRLAHVTARQQQERDLHIDKLAFTPVEKGMLLPLECTLASPFYYDPTSVRRIEGYLHPHGMQLHRCTTFTKLESAAGSRQRQCVLAQLILPLPPRFGIRTAMGRAPTRKEAQTLACMHAELIIDALGLALFPLNAALQAKHVEECARVRRWCAPLGDCDYRYTAVSPAPLELVERLDAATAAAAAAAATAPPSVTASGGVDSPPLPSSSHTARVPQGTAAGAAGREGGAVTRADIQVGGTSASSVESIMAQHQRAVHAALRFANESSMVDYENARLLLERYVEQFTGTPPPSSSSCSSYTASSPLQSLMFVEPLGQRDRRCFRATITVPLADPAGLASAAQPPLPYTESFVAMGVSGTQHVAELAASLHALRTLAALNRLTLHHGSATVLQALESFARRGHLPPHRPTAPPLLPSDVAAGELPAPVRVMDGEVGRILVSGAALAMKAARECVFAPGTRVQSMRGSIAESKVKACGEMALQRHLREDFMLRELQQARERLPRLDWDTTADADGRIVVAPDADGSGVRDHFHTVSSVRSPDLGAEARLRCYLERHGKAVRMGYTTARVQVAPDAPEEGFLYVTKLALPVPDLPQRRRGEQRGDEAAGGGGEVVRGVPPPVECVAQGEAPTKEESVWLCNVHAELLLDAMGIPLYDNEVVQRCHADTARMLGRWAPLARGGLLAPAALRPLPPPLRKVTAKSALWAAVQRSRNAAAAAEAGSRERPSASQEAAALSPSAAPDGAVNDDTLCDLSRLVFVQAKKGMTFDIDVAQNFFAGKGLDFVRAVHQYKVMDERYGAVHRAIVEVPVPARFGRRVAVGIADKKRLALRLCAQHVVHIIDALNIAPATTADATRDFKRRRAALGLRGQRRVIANVAAETPTPPGFYSLQFSEAAVEPPPSLPVCPPNDTPAAWFRYVRQCLDYITQRQAYLVNRAATALPEPRTPPSHVPVEDTLVRCVDPSLCEHSGVAQQLRRVAVAAGIEKAMLDYVETQVCRLTREKRVFVTATPLLGTPYVMRGVSADSPAESRQRAFLHGILMVQHVVRRNRLSGRRPRLEWVEGSGRRLHDAVTGDITHFGRVWVLRLWCALHDPPRSLRLQLHKEGDEEGEIDPEGEEEVAAATTVAPELVAVASPVGSVAGNGGSQESDADASSTLPPDQYRVSLTVVETTAAAAARDSPTVSATSAAAKVVTSESLTLAGEQHTAASCTRAIVHRLFHSLQRTPTMQALHRLLLQQPQLHLPSLRVLRCGGEEAVRSMLAAMPALAEPQKGTGCSVVPASLLSTLGTEAEAGSEERRQQPWPTAACSPDGWAAEALVRYIRCHGREGVDDGAKTGVAADLSATASLPQTLVPLLSTYGLLQRTAARHKQLDGAAASWAPTPLADAVALVCACLPPIGSESSSSSPSGSAASERTPSSLTMTVHRDRTLILQLAHLVVMGRLLDCVAWTARMAAMIACAEDTLSWYTRATTPTTTGTTAVIRGQDKAAPRPPVSVDVVEAALLSAEAGAPPLPDSVTQYADSLAQRLQRLWGIGVCAQAAAAVDSGSGVDTAWPPTGGSASMPGKGGEEHVSVMPPLVLPQLTSHAVSALRPLLQCAVAASAAPHEVWLRDAELEKLARSGERWWASDNQSGVPSPAVSEDRHPATGQGHARSHDSSLLCIFQGRRSARLAALRLDATRLLATSDGGCSASRVSTMATCFAVFGCAVEGTPLSSATYASSVSRLDAGLYVERCVGPPGLYRVPQSSQQATAEREGNTDDEGAAVDTDDDTEERDDTREDGEEGDAPVSAPDVAQYVQVFGTCVTPLAAAVVGASPSLSRSPTTMPQTAGLRVVEEDVPMLLAAFGDLVPLVVHHTPSAAALERLAAHLRQRIVHVVPFSEQERQVLAQLFTLPVDEMDVADGVE